jgi:exopolysaccharide biosynthesis polyprenyl glycosylphosphotransferase
MVVLSLEVVLANYPEGASQTIRQWAFALTFLALGRIVLDVAEMRARQRRRIGRPTLIVGSGRVGQLFAKRLDRYPEFGLHPIGFLDDAPWTSGEPADVPVLGGPEDLEEMIRLHGVTHVVVTFSTASHEVLLRVIERCERLGVGVSFVPRLFEKMKDKVSIESVGSIPLIMVEPTDPTGWRFSVKYVLDRIVAAALLILLSPLLAGTALAVWATSGRPILFRQVRVGRDGRPFELLKFRSMHPQEGNPPGPGELPPDTAPGGSEGADRTTTFGAALRRTALDELPQLINVLRGDMSLVGPRPERPEFVQIYQDEVHRYSDRHRVKAGITGWAQINGLRGNTSLSDRAEWDNYYIDNFSLWLDFKILVSTVSALARSPST